MVQIRNFIISNMYYKDYMSEYYKKNLEFYKDYYENNRERLIDQSLKYYRDHKLEIRKKQNAYYKQYYLKNKEKILMNRGKIYGKRYRRSREKIDTDKAIVGYNIVVVL